VLIRLFSGAGYSDIQYQTCTIPGSQPSQKIIPGHTYLEAMFGVKTNTLWRGIGVLIAFTAFFLIGTLIAGEKVSFETGGRMTKFYIKESEVRKKLNQALIANKEERRDKAKEEQKAELEITSKSTLTWEGLTYDVQTDVGTKRLLNGIDGYVQPGHLTALMGASG
jgi:ATP-binding cassette subfamily G (WHITE) protein 2 (SNQ2)